MGNEGTGNKERGTGNDSGYASGQCFRENPGEHGGEYLEDLLGE